MASPSPLSLTPNSSSLTELAIRNLEASLPLCSVEACDQMLEMSTTIRDIMGVPKEDRAAKKIEERTHLQFGMDKLNTIAWPACYRILNVDEAIRLHFLSFIKKHLKDLPKKAKTLIIHFLDQLNEQPFHAENKKLFKSFIDNLRIILGNNHPLVTKRFVKALNTLQDLCMIKELKDKRLVDCLPGSSADITPTPFMEELDLLNLLVFSSIDHLHSSHFMKTLKAIREEQKATSADFEDLEKILIAVHQLNIKFDVRKQIIINQINFLKRSSNNNPQQIKYALSLIQNQAKKLHEQLQAIEKAINEFLDKVSLYMDKTEVQLILREKDVDDLDKPKDDVFKPDTFLNMSFSTLETTVELAKKAKISKQLEGKGDHKADHKETNGVDKQKETTTQLENMLPHMLQFHKKMMEIGPALANLAESVKGLEKARDRKRNRIKKEFDKEVRKGQCKPAQRVLLEEWIKELYQDYNNLSKSIGSAKKGMNLLAKMVEKRLEEYSYVEDEKEQDNLDLLWPLYHDDMQVKVVAPEPEDKGDRKQVDAADSKDNVVEMQRTPVQEVPKSLPVKQSYFDYVQELSVRFLKSFEGVAFWRTKICAQDSVHHLKLLGHLADVFKSCLEKGQHAFLEHMQFALIRSACVMTEQNLSAEAVRLHKTEGVLSHDHLELLDAISLGRNLPAELYREVLELLKKVQLGTIGNRYPHATAAMLESREMAIPQTLKWLLNPSEFTPQKMVEFLVSLFRFVEIRNGQLTRTKPDHTFSSTVEKELLGLMATPAASSDKGEHPLKTKLVPAFRDLAKTKEWMTKRMAAFSKAGIPFSRLKILTLKDIAAHQRWLEGELNFWSALPKARVLATMEDPIWTHLQVNDEQVEILSALDHRKERIRGEHDIEHLRQLGSREESKSNASVVRNINVNIGGHYVNYGVLMFKQIGDGFMPEGLRSRQRALEVALDSDALDEKATPAKRKGKKKQLVVNTVAVMTDTLVVHVNAELDMTVTRFKDWDKKQAE